MDEYKQEKNMIVLFIGCYMSYLLIHWFACFFVVVVVFFGNTFIWLFTEKNSVTGNVSRFDVSPASLSASVSRFMI